VSEFMFLTTGTVSPVLHIVEIWDGGYCSRKICQCRTDENTKLSASYSSSCQETLWITET